MQCFEISRILDNIKKKKYSNDFFIESISDKINRDERCVEIPYALSRYAGQKNILEIGLSLADINLVKSQILLKKYTNANLCACDIVDINRVKNRFIELDEDVSLEYEFSQTDVRKTSYNDSIFDFIFLISTLEHVGFDEFDANNSSNSVFLRDKIVPKNLPIYEDCNEDVNALIELSRILKKNGSIIITLPFGKRGICLLKDSKNLFSMYKEYSYEAWKKLISKTGLTIVESSFFSYDKKFGWINVENSDDIDNSLVSIESPVKNVICAELKKMF
tara:strand:+ start:2106 stop:2933 length:828 start_codon:yes stop_codon:yes gene_type:complete